MGAAIIVAGFVPQAHAQTQAPAPAAGPIFGVTYIEAIPADVSQVIGQLKTATTASRKANGNIGYLVLQRSQDKNQFAILEAWPDQASMDADAALAPVKAAFAAVVPHLRAPIDRRPQTPMAVDSSRLKAALAPETGHVFVISHVDIQPAFKDQGMATVLQFDSQDKTASGNLEFDLTQQTNRLNHVSLIEVWRNASDQRAHAIDPSTISFRNTVLPMSGAPYDERVYSPVE